MTDRAGETWTDARQEALEAALNGEPPETSLGVLARAVLALGPGTRAAFLLANEEGTALDRVVGMPAACAEALDDLKRDPESPAFGLATHARQPVLTTDVTEDARWAPWLWLAERFDFRACWSFPIVTAAGKFVGTLAVYSRQPRAATPRDLELISRLAHTASVILGHHSESKVRKQAEDALRASEGRFRALVQASSDVVYVMGPDWTEMRQLVGRNFIADSEQPNQSWLQRYIPPDDRECVIAAIEHAIHTKTTFELKHRVVRADGSLGWTFSRAIPILDAAGEITEWFGMAADITARAEAEAALRANLDAMTILHRLGMRWVRESQLPPILQEIVEAAIAVTDADFGNIQLLDAASGDLKIAAQRGFPPWWIEFWDSVAMGRGVCGTALERGQRVIVEDVELSPIFRGTPLLDVQLRAGVRAVQSTPLITRTGRVVGMFSTHCKSPRQWDELTLTLLDLLARQAADLIERVQADAERERLLSEVQAQRDRLSALVASMQDEVWFADTQQRFVLANPAGLKGFGLDTVESTDIAKFAASLEVQRPDGSPRPPDEAPPLRALKGEIVSQQEEIVRMAASGELRYRQVSATPVRDPAGRIIGSVSVVRDITGHKQAEESLRRSEARWNAAIESFAAGAILVTEDEQIIYWNPAARVMHGFTHSDEGIGSLESTRRTFQLWSSDGSHLLELDEWPVRRIKRGETLRDLELRIYRPDQGWEKTFSYNGTMVETGAGERLIFLTCQDLTELRRTERALLEADRRKTEFLAILAHELRNPLAPISNAVHILKDRAAPDPIVPKTLDIINRQLTHLVRLIDDLLDVSRITRGRLHLRKERVELLAALNHAVDSVRPCLEQAGHALTLSLPPRGVQLNADPVRLTQIFVNLLHNACKYTERGGHITLTAEPEGTEIVVTVSDNGIGIPPEHLPNIFGMFSQVESVLERSQGGLGIGLALTKGLVQMHGGSIDARSSGAGQGTEMIVRLPLCDAPADPLKPTPPKLDNTPRVSTLRILVVDDNPDITESLAVMLTLRGYTVEKAYDGRQAVEAAADLHPDVILLDIGLPELDGYGACRRIRDESGAHRPRIFAMTGWAQDEDRRRSREAGFDGHLVKPVDPAVLMQLLEGSQAASL